MEYTNLGCTGTKVSRICLGCMTYGTKKWREWVLEEEEGRPFIRRALELGINFFDTADMYSLGRSEEVLGRSLKDFGPSRDKLVIATKVFFPLGDDPNQKGLSRKHIMHAIDDSLRRLGTDYVDLYQIHRFDYETPIEETLEALHDVVKAGKALYIGASSMYAWQFARMLYISDRMGWTRFVAMQNHYNLIYREEEREMAPLCRAERVGMLPWSPLARGLLAGSRRSGTLRAQTDDYAHKLYTREADEQVIDAVAAIAKERGIPPAQVALAWLLHQPGVTAPIIGASKMNHLEDAVAAVQVKLSREEMDRLESVYVPHPVLGHH
ncbi:MAG TPA: aldo/keto reductase [Terriglobales bacterium]|nr:aldo/keto reductase [Terriglobales bacterium]